MASISLNLEKRTQKNGMYLVRLCISHAGTKAYINTGIYVEQECFTSDLYTPLTKKAYLYKDKTERIRAYVTKADQVLFDIDRDDSLSLDTMDAKDIRTYIIGERAPKQVRVTKARARGRQDFMDWFDKFGHDMHGGQKKKSPKTIRSYVYAWNLLHEYCQTHGRDRLYFDDLGYTLFVDIKQWLFDTGRGESVRHQVEANMHAAWREAKRMKMLPSADDPWEDYQIEKVAPPMKIEYADIEDIRRIAHFDTRGINGEEWLNKARDMMLLSWYFCGCNLKDVYYMPKPKDGEFVFMRQKALTEKKRARNEGVRPVHIRIEPEIRALLDKYRGREMAFSFAEDVPNYYTFLRKVEDRIDRLCKLAGTDINMQMIRRSWGTYALRKTKDRIAVDMSLGHVPSGMLMEHYAAYDWEDTARCNRAMIDMLWEK